MIDPAKLRQKLDEVWVGLGQKSAQAGEVLMRACALTLITATDEEEDPVTRAQTLAELMHEHPSRTIVVRLNKGNQELLEADVEALCWMPFGGRQQICSEQIVIRCSDKTLAEVPGVILPLVEPDLPVVFWCASRRLWPSPAFALLVAPAGRILIDTFQTSRPLQAVAQLLTESRLGGALVRDLSWTRLTRWRSLLAQVFENQIYRRQIPLLRQVVVHWQGAETARIPPTALLMGSWLVTSLGWEWEHSLAGSGRDVPLGFRHPDGEAQLVFCRRASGAASPRLAGLELLSGNQPASRISLFRSGPDCGEVGVEMGGQPPVRNRVSLPPSTELMLLSEELAIERKDSAFEKSLEGAARIASLLSMS